MTPADAASLRIKDTVYAILDDEIPMVTTLATVASSPVIVVDAVLVPLILEDGRRRTLLSDRLERTAAKAIERSIALMTRR